MTWRREAASVAGCDVEFARVEQAGATGELDDPRPAERGCEIMRSLAPRAHRVAVHGAVSDDRSCHPDERTAVARCEGGRSTRQGGHVSRRLSTRSITRQPAPLPYRVRCRG